jgi:hypothetical protein
MVKIQGLPALRAARAIGYCSSITVDATLAASPASQQSVLTTGISRMWFRLHTFKCPATQAHLHEFNLLRLAILMPGTMCGLMLLSTVFVSAQEATPLTSQAVVRLTFDEPDGPALDSAAQGQTADQGLLLEGATRVPSPFWNHQGRRAVRLDANSRQAIEIADSPDVDRNPALTLGLLVVNLMEPSDGAFRGLFAKRGVRDGQQITNFGINFVGQNDILQLYLNDGAGYGVVHYSVKDVLPYRQRVFLTVTYTVGDAPAPDADTDADDIRVQLFVNGQVKTPRASLRSMVSGAEGWFTDVSASAILNDVPVSIGRSEPNVEYFSGVVDEFVLLPTALAAEQIPALFREVCGADVEQKMKDDEAAPSLLPDIARFSQAGVTRGQTTQIVIAGQHLGSAPRVLTDIPHATVTLVGEPSAERLTAQLTVPADTVPGLYPVWVSTTEGTSAPLPLAVDGLPHRPADQATADAPTALPAALFGVLSGGQRPRMFFQGQRGQSIVAEVELQRLGGKAQPVLELKTARDAPVAISWGQASLDGDARLSAVLPADGLYAIELHDLVYRAPGANPYRLKLGDLQLLDGIIPAAVNGGEQRLTPVGTGFDPQASLVAVTARATDRRRVPVQLSDTTIIAGPWPVAELALGSEVVEQTDTPLTPAEATFTDPQAPPLGLNGRLVQPGEQDRFLLNVTPGQTLRFTLQSVSLRSPLTGELELAMHPGGQVVALSPEQPDSTDPQLDYAVPAGVTQLVATVRSRFGTGSLRDRYRVAVFPAQRPQFSLQFNTERVNLPADGSALIELQVNRTTYQGPITLQVLGATGLVIEPAEIAAGVSGTVFCRLRRTAPPAEQELPLVRITGSSKETVPVVTEFAIRTGAVAGPLYSDAMTVGQTAPQGLSMAIVNPPAVLFRGYPTPLTLQLERQDQSVAANKPIRLARLSNEPVRPRQPGNPAAGNIPVIDLLPMELVSPTAPQATAMLSIPLDVAVPHVELAITAEAVTHEYSQRVSAKAVSQPFRAEIKNAVAPAVDAASLAVVGGTSHAVQGQLARTAGFTGSVDVTLIDLPAGYAATAVSVPGEQNAFTVLVTAPAVTAETPVPNVKLRVSASGSLLVADQPVALKVVPAAAN